MPGSVRITHAAFVSATDRERDTGLLGWITCIVNNVLLLDCIAARRTRDGQLRLSFPSRSGKTGKKHPYFRPTDDAARKHLESEIFKALNCDLGESTP